MPLLARRYSGRPSQASGTGIRACVGLSQPSVRPALPTVRRLATSRFSIGAVAACLLVVSGLGVYRFVQRTIAATEQVQSAAELGVQHLNEEKRTLASQLNAQQQKLAQMESSRSRKREEIERLRSELQGANQRSGQLASALAAAQAGVDKQLRIASEQRDSLNTRLDSLNASLQDIEQAYKSAKAELVSMRAERDRAMLRMASLETDNSVLVANRRDQERRLRNQEQYLASDRDIRELMGARQLYMADVFDVSSDSRTRRPYGRVFYTKSKSLIFYAFDLDRQPGIKNAAFQAWGQNESSRRTPVNLGILYQDSEQNRRWVLRFDDPQQLVEIDAVFVTIEPHGGSDKPTGKRFLYASLRREPNHP